MKNIKPNLNKESGPRLRTIGIEAPMESVANPKAFSAERKAFGKR